MPRLGTQSASQNVFMSAPACVVPISAIANPPSAVNKATIRAAGALPRGNNIKTAVPRNER